jgi:hypothetical protein
MSFNASFGDVIEDSNVVLTDVNANNNEMKIVNSEIPINNLSFDGLDNLNSNNNETNKNNEKIDDSIPIQNDIFNSIPMEIENENEKILYYQNEITIEKINYFIIKLLKNINNRFLLTKLEVFLLIKKISNKKHLKLIHAELMYMKLINNLKLMLRIYRRNNKNKLNKYYKKWKNNYLLNNQLNIAKNKIEENLQKLNEQKLINLNKEIKDFDKDIEYSNKTLLNLQTHENELKNKFKNVEDQENKLNQKKNNLYNLVLKNKDILNSKINDSTNEIKNLENKIKLLENKINNIKEDNKKKEIAMNNFIKEMEPMIQTYEQNFENLENMNFTNLNTNNNSSPHNNNNIICFTAGSLNNFNGNNNNKKSNSLRNNFNNKQKYAQK